jgi:hypothetical protein
MSSAIRVPSSSMIPSPFIQPESVVAGRFEDRLLAAQAELETGDVTKGALAFSALLAEAPTELSLVEMTANAWSLVGDLVRVRSVWLSAYTCGVRGDAASQFTLGSGLLQAGAPAEARACLERVARLLPRDPAALGALASALRADGDLPRAWSTVQRALALANPTPALFLTAAQIRHAQGNARDAERWLAKAERVRPDHGPTRLQRAFTTLIQGARDSGWRDFEARGVPRPNRGARAWRGESLEGASIAVRMEQGLGDLFHFVRYVRRLELLGASRVVVECPPSVVGLLRASGFDAVASGQLPTTDWSVPVLSLPQHLGSDTDTASDLVPYLTESPQSATAPHPRGPAGLRRVGLVVAGNPAFAATALRDLSEDAISAMLGIADVQWVWLQFGAPVPESPAGARAIEPVALSGDWLDTARILRSLDGLVTVDTSLAHLAGAMGLPAWVLLPYSPDWRWGFAGDRTPWYPSLHLLRQSAPRDWRGPIARLREVLTSSP